MIPQPHSIELHEIFSDQYISLRKKEGRMYGDEEVRLLPEVCKGHLLENEWRVRKRSANNLVRYLASKKSPLRVLEIGCGNGWLSNMIASVKNIQVTGIDINVVELEQAMRVFSNPSLNFIHGSIGDLNFIELKFDIIVFASSIQYFPSLTYTTRACMQLLSKNGEIHILDSNFYSAKEKPGARLRSRQYFSFMGAPLMDSYYFHHSLKELDCFRFKIFNKVQMQLQKFSGSVKNFPWICIKKQPC